MIRINLFILLALVSTVGHGQQNLVLCCENQEQFPYVVGDTSQVLKQPGISIDMARLAAKEQQLSVSIIRNTWPNCLEKLKTGHVDGVLNASYQPHREQYGRFPLKEGKIDKNRRLTTLSYALYKLANTDVSWNGEQFLNLQGSISAPWGHSITNHLKALHVPVYLSSSMMQGLQQLLSNKVAGLAVQTLVADPWLKKHPQYQSFLTKVEPPLLNQAYYLMFSKRFYQNNEKAAEKLWNHIAWLRENKLKELAGYYSD